MSDAEGRPTDQHELNRQLADTIGAQVERLLGMSNYSEVNNVNIDAALLAARSGNAAGDGQPDAGGGSTQGQPAPAGQPGSAGNAPAAPARPQAPVTPQEGEIDWESTKAANGLYLGKYASKAEAVRGVANTVAMAKVAFTQRDEALSRETDLRKQLDTLRTQPAVTPAAAPQATPAPTPSRGMEKVPNAKLDSVLSKLREDGNLDAESLGDLVSAIRENALDEARRAAREEIDSRTAVAKAEADRWGKVEAYMAEKHPQSVNLTDELALYIKTHPMIAAGVAALIAQDKHEEATEQAWLLMSKDMKLEKPFVPAPATRENVEKEIKLDAADQVRREAVDQARKDAGIVGAGAGARGVHENANTGPTQGDYDEAVALMNQGDGRKWRALVFGDALNHPIFG